MKKVECVSIRETVPDQVLIGETYWIDEGSEYTDSDLDTYVNVYQDESKSNLIGKMLLSHFSEIDEGDEFDDNYIKQVNAEYWLEEDEFKEGNHPSQILERVRLKLDKMGIDDKITFMDYNIKGSKVKVYTSRFEYIPFGIFDYEDNVFSSIFFEIKFPEPYKDFVNKILNAKW